MKTKLKKWQLASSKLIYKHRYIELYKDQVILPSGQKYEYLVTNKGCRAVIVLALDQKQRILFTKEFRYPVNEVLYSLVSGVVEVLKKETPLQAVRRELKEETGYRPGTIKLLDTFYASPARSATMFYAFMATNLKPGKPQPEFMEFIETEFLPEKKIDAMIKKGEIKDPYTLAAYLLYKFKKAPWPK